VTSRPAHALVGLALVAASVGLAWRDAVEGPFADLRVADIWWQVAAPSVIATLAVVWSVALVVQVARRRLGAPWLVCLLAAIWSVNATALTAHSYVNDMEIYLVPDDTPGLPPGFPRPCPMPRVGDVVSWTISREACETVSMEPTNAEK
jgi:hypothetical protein